jgi:outer membrane protein insertion porin family
MTFSRSIVVIATVAAAAPTHADPDERPPTGRFELGAGFSPDEGFLALARIAQDDLFRTGQRLVLTAEFSALRQDASVMHELPDALGSGLDLRTELFTERRLYPGGRSESAPLHLGPGFERNGAGGAVSLGHQIDRATRVYVRYRAEHVGVTLDDTTAAARMALPPNLGDGLVATLGAGVAYDTRDSPLPTRGTHLELFGDVADRELGSDYQLARAGAVLDHARPLGPFTLRVHGHAGFVMSRDPSGVPLAERLQYAGNADVRGFGLGTLGTYGSNADAIGRGELELPVFSRVGISVAGFADAGVVYNADAMWGPVGARAVRSVGFGLIWRSPIGPLRFDYAFPLDGSVRGCHFLFGLGAPW